MKGSLKIEAYTHAQTVKRSFQGKTSLCSPAAVPKGAAAVLLHSEMEWAGVICKLVALPLCQNCSPVGTSLLQITASDQLYTF